MTKVLGIEYQKNRRLNSCLLAILQLMPKWYLIKTKFVLLLILVKAITFALDDKNGGQAFLIFN